MVAGKYVNDSSNYDYTNYGLIFKMFMENQTLEYINFYTNDNAPDDLNKPTLVIKYVVPNFN